MMNIIPVILCGGKGTRLWPLSNNQTTKPFLNVFENTSLFQLCIQRSLQFTKSPPWVICNAKESHTAKIQLDSMGIKQATILEEPCPRNTAPAATLAALYAEQLKEDALLLLLPGDQIISDVEALDESIQAAAQFADKNHIAIFGVTPTYPHTGYGYIQAGRKFSHTQVFAVNEFIEKPPLDMATHMVRNKKYYWNCGIFLFRASVFLEEMKQFRPDILNACTTTLKNSTQSNNQIILSHNFSECPSESIDYAVMEKTKKAILAPIKSHWSDIGCWNAVHEMSQQDLNGNSVSGNVVLMDCKNNYIRSEYRTVGTVGMTDTIIVETPNSVLVANKNFSQEVKKLALLLEEKQPKEKDNKTLRPWGYFENILTSSVYQVKRLVLHPSCQISLQLHKQRSEHWIIVEGKAEVINGDKQFVLTTNQSIFIPKETKHRLKNIGTENLIVIEVQHGHYLGEDDIVRFLDDYGRVDIEKDANFNPISSL